MDFISERIQSLGFSASECGPLIGDQLVETLELSKNLFSKARKSEAARCFSTECLSLNVVTQELNNFGIEDEFVMVCWPAYQECFRIKWTLFTANFDDFFYPSSDDILVTTPEGRWLIEVDHEEIIRFFNFEVQK